MLRLLIIVCLVLFQPNAKASQNRICGEKDTPTDCNQEAGCYWSTEGDGYCNFCDKDYYCPSENTDTKSPTACSTLEGDFNFTDNTGYGAASDCYKNIRCYIYDTDEYCIQYYDTNAIICNDVIYPFEYNAKPNQGSVHLEKMSGGYNTATECFTNVISCNRVQTTTTTNCTKDGSKKAKYYYYGVNSEDQYWDISACRCTQKDKFLNSPPAANANCYAAITRQPNPSRISYMTTAGPNWEIESYHCTGCKNGWMPVNGTPDSDFCNPTPAPNIFGAFKSICSCEKVPKGYYAENCSFEENPYYTVGTNNNCVTACPAGKTTNATGASDATYCHYTDQTKFCDSKGCFSLSDIQDWTEVQ